MVLIGWGGDYGSVKCLFEGACDLRRNRRGKELVCLITTHTAFIGAPYGLLILCFVLERVVLFCNAPVCCVYTEANQQ